MVFVQLGVDLEILNAALTKLFKLLRSTEIVYQRQEQSMVQIHSLKIFENGNFQEMVLRFVDQLLQKCLAFELDSNFQKGSQLNDFY